mmetsp:Transcript_7010/g.15101  ORF Transcript_7010/g.15101 Transcript_7010/m.15101 type:complete len:427 (+) Transcript_7010:75-1355(+)
MACCGQFPAEPVAAGAFDFNPTTSFTGGFTGAPVTYGAPAPVTYAAPSVTYGAPAANYAAPATYAQPGQPAPGYYQQAQQQQVPATVKMTLGDWMILEDDQGEFYQNSATGQTFDQPPQELLTLFNGAQQQQQGAAAPMTYGAPAPAQSYQYAQPQASYAQPQASYAQPQVSYAAPQVTYAAPQGSYGQAQSSYTPPPQYAQPQAQVSYTPPPQPSYTQPSYAQPSYAQPSYQPQGGSYTPAPMTYAAPAAPSDWYPAAPSYPSAAPSSYVPPPQYGQQYGQPQEYGAPAAAYSAPCYGQGQGSYVPPSGSFVPPPQQQGSYVPPPSYAPPAGAQALPSGPSMVTYPTAGNLQSAPSMVAYGPGAAGQFQFYPGGPQGNAPGVATPSQGMGPPQEAGAKTGSAAAPPQAYKTSQKSKRIPRRRGCC